MPPPLPPPAASRQGASSLLDAISRGLDYTRQLDWLLHREEPHSSSVADSDRAGGRVLKSQNIASGGKIFFGKVVDTLPVAGWYKVQPEIALPIIPCCLAFPAARGYIGARPLTSLTADARVGFVWHPSLPYGVICCVLPEQVASPDAVQGDQISLQSAGFGPDEATLNTLLSLGDLGSLYDWSSGGPRDVTGVGEAGWITETGVMIFIDSMMAILRANEDTGVWVSRYDDLLRIAGHNLQKRSSLLEEEHLDDEGELWAYLGWVIYNWEYLGAFLQGITVANLGTPDPKIGTQSIEPLYPDQQVFARAQAFHGYPGQGGRRLVCLPGIPDSYGSQASVSPTSGEIFRLTGDTVLPGVFLEQIALTGAYALASAKSITFSKRILLPTPKRLIRPEDQQGDNRTNYKAGGAQGAGPNYAVSPEVRDTSSDRSGAAALASSRDRYAYIFGRQAHAPFRAHTKDWFVPETNDPTLLGGVLDKPITYGDLYSTCRLPEPNPLHAYVDHRYDMVRYIPNSSVREQADSGAIYDRDGWNSCMQMVGGNLEISVPGDIVLRPGRSVILKAGKDIILQARDAIDESTTYNDIRLRAGGNLKMKGNEVDIYSNTSLLLDARNGPCRVWVEDFYLKAGALETTPGSINLDAGPAGVLTYHAYSVERFLVSGAFDFFLTQVSGIWTVTSANSYAASGSTISGNLAVAGCLDTGDAIYAGNWVYAIGGHFASGAGDTYGGLVQNFTPSAQALAASTQAAAQAAIAQPIAAGETVWVNTYLDCLYATGGPGNLAFITSTYFTYRSVSQYATSGYTFYESPWQQQARLSGLTTNLTAWVEAAEHGTYPYPGTEVITGNSYLQVDLGLVDPTTGKELPSTNSNYINPVYQTPRAVNMNANYLVVNFI